MRILYLADPTSIHDVRWINFFAGKKGTQCFIVPRDRHLASFDSAKSILNQHVRILSPISDPSTSRPWRNCITAYKIKRILLEHRIQIFHILYAEPNALWANWKWLFRIPIIITTRGSDILKTIPAFFERRTFFDRIISWKYRNALSNADHITSTSMDQIRNLKRLGITANSALVRTGVDFSLIVDDLVGLAFMEKVKMPFVLMPRSMRPIYNHDFTLDAIALLSPVIRQKYAFVFLDCDTSEDLYFSGVHKRAQTIDATIQFLPALLHADLLRLYRCASLVVMNPLSDGSPVTAMEAMACKVPVILPPLNYDEDIFGFVFRFREWTHLSLKDKIEKVLMLDERALADLNELNFQKVLQQGNTELEMEKLAAIYAKGLSHY